MKKKLRIILALLLCCQLLLSGCSNAIESLTEKIREMKAAQGPAAGHLGAAMRPIPVGIGLNFVPGPHFPEGFETKYPLEQGSWTTEKPFIDPLGSEGSYSEVYKDYTAGEIRYFNEDYRLTSRRVAGDHWVMYLLDDAPDALLHLEKYIINIGGKLLSPAGNEFAFTLEEGDYSWWGKITQQEDGIRLEMYRELCLQVGKTITITPADREKAESMDAFLFFTTRHKGDRMQSMTVTLSNADEYDLVDLYAYGGYSSGRYNRKVEYYNELIANTSKSKVFILDDIPQEPGDTGWSFSVYGEGATVSFTLNEVADLEPVSYGEDMGALLIKGAPYGSVCVPIHIQDEHTTYSISHPEIIELSEMLYGDPTPEGDTLFWLPSGYWNLSIDSDVLNSTSHARIIPVSQGELTVVELASNINSIFSQTSGRTEGTTEQGMTFLDLPTEQGDQVELKFLLYDSENKGAVPTKETTAIFENDEPVEIISIEKLDIPPSVVLLLDSSGSMADEMKPAVEAAKAFVQGLPDHATIHVIDFDNTARKLDGTTKAEVLKSLDTVTEGGYTALYDATMMGLELLQGTQRPTLVIFTDGKNEPVAGGLTDKSLVVEAIKDAGVPVYTIGFGKEHAPVTSVKDPNSDPDPDPDIDTEPSDDSDDNDDETPKSKGSDLIDFAKISDGKYYSALDQDALNNVFAAIAARLGNTYTAIYKRPQLTNVSNVPVVTVVLDCSGSMSEPIEGQGTKMQMTKDLFRDFIIKIPDGIMTQLIIFEDIELAQVLTTDKAAMLQAVSSLESGGSTYIVESAELAYDTLKAVPTSNRILVFLTDAAMEGRENEVFAELLVKMKDAHIKSLWLGLGLEQTTAEENFAWVAQASGGSYLLPNSAQELSDGLNKMLNEIHREDPNDKTIISMDITITNEAGKPQRYTNSLEHKLSPLKTSDKTEAPPQAIKILTNQPADHIFANRAADGAQDGFAQYSPEVSQLLYGTDSPSMDTRIHSRVPLQAKAGNKAMEVAATEYYRMGKLRGIEPPAGMEYLAVNLQLKNLLPDSAYQIPDISSHFYLSVNDSGLYPASVITWLAQTPLAKPGENGVTIQSGETAAGILLFLVPAERYQDLHLEFYDTVNGHIQMRMLGGIKKSEVQLEDLPTLAPAKLSDAFTLTVKAYKDVDKIQQHTASQNMIYRIVEGEITSNVQALLDIMPAERFFMNIITERGTVSIPISPVTGYIPLGYLQPKLLAPGSTTPIRWVFEIPKGLVDAKAEVYGDISDGVIHIPIKNGSTSSSTNMGTFKGEWMDVTINELGLLSFEEYQVLRYRYDVEEPGEEEPGEEEQIDEEPNDEEPVEEEPYEEDSTGEEPYEEEPYEEEPVEEDLLRKTHTKRIQTGKNLMKSIP